MSTLSEASASEASAPEVSEVGPYFGMRTGGPGPGPGYVPLAEVYAGTGAGGWARHVDTVAGRLGTDETRVAASIAFQGIAARLWSIGLGSAALTGRIPDIAPARLCWNPLRTAPADLWLPSREPGQGREQQHKQHTEQEQRGQGADIAAALREAVVLGHLVPLLRATRAVTPVAEALLLGNAASALAGTLRVLTGWCRSAGRPRAADRALALTRALLADPALRGTGTLAEEPDRGGCPPFRRRSCCLYYRVPGGGLCGDCVFDRPPA